jgi:hypothetical protein
MEANRWVVLGVIIGVLAIVPLLTGVWGLSFATKESLRRNSTRGFFANVGTTMRGQLWGVLPTLPIIIVLYLFVCAIVSVRLLRGAEPGVTSRHVRGLLIGAVLAPIVVGCTSAFLIVPIMNSWDLGTLEANGVGGLYRFFSTWWLPSLLAIPFGAFIGLSRIDTPATSRMPGTSLTEAGATPDAG